MKAALLSLIALFFSVAAQAATAAITTQTYEGTILSTEGPRGDAFPVGANVTVTTTFDTSAADTIPGSQFGYYPDGLDALVITLPDSGFSTTSAPGELSIGNDVPGTEVIEDYVILYSFASAEPGTIEGYPVHTYIAEFRQVLPPGSVPNLIVSDAVPTQPLAGTTYAVLRLGTDLGFTSLTVALTALAPTVAELVTDARIRINEFVALGQLNRGIGVSLLARLDAIQRSSSRESTAACGPLAGLRFQVRSLSRSRPEQIALAGELQAIVAALDVALVQC